MIQHDVTRQLNQVQQDVHDPLLFHHCLADYIGCGSRSLQVCFGKLRILRLLPHVFKQASQSLRRHKILQKVEAHHVVTHTRQKH